MSQEIITSSSNPYIKYVKSLIKKPGLRKRDNVYLVEGMRMIKDAPEDDIHTLIVSSELMTESEALELVLGPSARHFSEEAIGEDVNAMFLNIVMVSPEVIKSVSETVTPQGIVAVMKRKEYTDYKGKSSYLLLEDIQDPGNLGTLMRTAEAAGIDVVIMSRGCVDIYNPKTIRSTMGTIYRQPFITCNDMNEWDTIVDDLIRDGVKLYGGYLDDSSYYADVDFTARCGIVIGNEGNGISDEMIAKIDKVNIPMNGEIESLNASVAGSILMYEMNRQRYTR